MYFFYKTIFVYSVMPTASYTFLFFVLRKNVNLIMFILAFCCCKERKGSKHYKTTCTEWNSNSLSSKFSDLHPDTLPLGTRKFLIKDLFQSHI